MRNRLVIIVFLITSVVFLFLLLLCRLDNYKDNLRYRLDPLEENRAAVKPDLKGNDFWIIGDSRAAGWETSRLDFISIRPLNLGIEGQTSRQVLERFSNDIVGYLPYCILLQVGINDLKCIGLLGDETITRTCLRNIFLILETCREQDIKAIYSSIFPPGDIELFRRPFWEPAALDSLMLVNDEIRNYCQENGFIYFDTFKLLESPTRSGRVANEYQKDFLHINARGYQHLSDRLQYLLQSLDEDWVRYMIE